MGGPNCGLGAAIGGWAYDKGSVEGKDWVHRAYAAGVPMGADLRTMPTGQGAAPRFVVWAMKDPTSGSLDRIQIIKGWSKNGQSFEKIYDVAWSGDRKPDPWTGRVPAVRNTVDFEKASYTNENGASELKAAWTDPDFDASLHAFYYARVLEVPTPRWTLIQSVKAGLPPPDVGFWWHSRQDCALYSGPSPSATSSTLSNFSRSAWWV